MKKFCAKQVVSARLIQVLVVLTLLLAMLDVVVHHHGEACFLPDFARYVVLSLFGCLALIGIAVCLAPIISRRGDYYDE